MAIKYSDGSTSDSGRIIQVKQTLHTVDETYSLGAVGGSIDGNYVTITQLNCSITPKTTSSKILVQGQVYGESNIPDHFHMFRYLRDSTAIGVGTESNLGVRGSAMMSQSYYDNDNSTTANQTTLPMIIDSPSTTSSVTYKIQITCTENTSSTFNLNRCNTTSTAQVWYSENGVSCLTLFEIAG